MRCSLLAMLAVAACAGEPALAPYDTTPQPMSSAPDSAGMNHDGVVSYNGKRHRDAVRAFRAALAYVPDARYFFNLCLALTAVDELDDACQACRAVPRAARADFDRDPEMRDDLLARTRRQLARVEALAKQRAAPLRCEAAP